MNFRSRHRQQKIPTINFHEPLHNFATSKRRYENYNSASSPNISHTAARPRTSDYKKFETNNQHPMSGLLRRQANKYRDQQIEKDDQYQQGLYQQEMSDQQNRQFKKQQQRHLEFVKSYNQWLKETQVEEYQSSRMINSFALKKTRASLKPKKQADLFQFKVYQPHFDNSYHPPNLFPARTHKSLKKMQPKSSRNYQRLKQRNEGELKLQMMKSITKREASTKQQKSSKKRKVVCTDQSNKNHQLFMKTFSNPKLLSIKNGQLVTGTKILFIN